MDYHYYYHISSPSSSPTFHTRLIGNWQPNAIDAYALTRVRTQAEPFSRFSGRADPEAR